MINEYTDDGLNLKDVRPVKKADYAYLYLRVFISFWSVDQDYSLVFFLILYNFSRYSEYLCTAESQAPEVRVAPYKQKEGRERKKEREGGRAVTVSSALLPFFRHSIFPVLRSDIPLASTMQSTRTKKGMKVRVRVEANMPRCDSYYTSTASIVRYETAGAPPADSI